MPVLESIYLTVTAFVLFASQSIEPVKITDYQLSGLNQTSLQITQNGMKKNEAEAFSETTPVPAPNLTLKPKPSPQPKPVPAPQDINLFFAKYANEYGVDENLLKKIAKCESGYNPKAVNGPYSGLYQFTAGSWGSARKTMGLDASPDLRFNPEEAIKTAAFKISAGGISAWPNCGR